jgi:hypothetical protein
VTDTHDSIPGLDLRRPWPPWSWVFACVVTGVAMGVHTATSPTWRGPLGLRALAVLSVAEVSLAVSGYLGWRRLRKGADSIVVLTLLPITPFVVGAFTGAGALESLGSQGAVIPSIGGLVLHSAIQLTTPLVDFGAFDSSLLLMLVAGLLVLGGCGSSAARLIKRLVPQGSCAHALS